MIDKRGRGIKRERGKVRKTKEGGEGEEEKEERGNAINLFKMDVPFDGSDK